jgi:hypothetical protein
MSGLWTVVDDVTAERARQDNLRDMGAFRATLADEGLSASDRLAVVAEEFGEVAEHVADALTGAAGRPLDERGLREELIQLAACAVAWVEYLDKRRQTAVARTVPPPAPLYASDVYSDGLAGVAA